MSELKPILPFLGFIGRPAVFQVATLCLPNLKDRPSETRSSVRSGEFLDLDGIAGGTNSAAAEGDTDAEAFTAVDGETDAEGPLGAVDGDADDERDAEPLSAPADGEAEGDNDPEGLWLVEGEREKLCEILGDTDAEEDKLAEGEIDALKLAD